MDSIFSVSSNLKLYLIIRAFLSSKKYFLAIIVSVAVIGFTLGVYAYYSELRDTHGKCLISFLLSLLLIYIFLPITRFNRFMIGNDPISVTMIILMISGFLLNFFWFTAICFHVYWRLK